MAESKIGVAEESVWRARINPNPEAFMGNKAMLEETLQISDLTIFIDRTHVWRGPGSHSDRNSPRMGFAENDQANKGF